MNAKHKITSILRHKKSTTSRGKVLDHIKAWGEPDNRATFALLGEEGQETIGVCAKGSGKHLFDMFACAMDKREDIARFILFVANEYSLRHKDDKPNDNNQ